MQTSHLHALSAFAGQSIRGTSGAWLLSQKNLVKPSSHFHQIATLSSHGSSGPIRKAGTNSTWREVGKLHTAKLLPPADRAFCTHSTTGHAQARVPCCYTRQSERPGTGCAGSDARAHSSLFGQTHLARRLYASFQIHVLCRHPAG